ncbi:hypothetical protein F4818DRAFT_413442 [Hypoxylon cercidicola]|nr:hypothetical protein F4818DRAFT_413442 [Hypoxylon cercidicola]
MTQRRPPSTMARSRNSNRELPLPSGYVSIREILEESIPVGRFVGVIGLVKDRRSPMQTGGTDWKSSITLYDKSIEDQDAGLVVTIFRPQSKIPEPDAGDVVIASSIKVQSYRGEVSLITHRSTSLHVYAASKIPKPPKSAKQALGPPLKQTKWVPGDKEHEYVAWLYHSIDKDAVPDATTFESRVDQSRNFRQKFQLLSNVQDGQFCDIIGRVIKDPFNQMDKATVWVSDYTENDAFHKFSWDPAGASKGQDGDPYGYTTLKNTESSNWPGPYGKRTIQVTCFGLHAEYASKEVKAGDWVRLRNLQVKYGHNSNNLEGFLREDRSSYGSGVQIDILLAQGRETTEDRENIDDRLKAAIKRRKDYEKTEKKQKKSLTANQGGKRKAGGGTTTSKPAKQRRTDIRNAKFKEIDEMELERQRKKEAQLGLNEIIKSESSDQPIFTVPSILEPISWATTVDKEKVTLTLPFSNIKYRANVRVVDFRPSKLENFATWRKSTEYDILSDCSSDSESESDDDAGTLDRYSGTKIWEWSFALQLEEADPKEKGENDKLWVVVDNKQGQMLTDLTASDLRANPDDLSQLREQLFKLWGNLEERKQQELQRRQANRKRIAAQQPPESSPPGPSTSHTAHKADNKKSTLSNKPFTCCIYQYGVMVPETDPLKATAGDGKRWERMFALFGTKISS